MSEIEQTEGAGSVLASGVAKEPPLPPQPNPGAVSARRVRLPAPADAALLLLALTVTAAWSVIARWYSLPANRDNTHFAFEKLPGHTESPILRGTLLLFVGLSVAYAVGFLFLNRQRRLSRFAKAATVLLVVGPGVANLLVYPVGALDAFNYMIELKLTYHYGENPYLVTFAGFRDDPFALPAFLVDVPLFYGPAWLLTSWLPSAIGGFADFVRLLVVLKIFNLLLLAASALVIARAQEQRPRAWAAAYLFAANPLVLFEGIGNAHNDVLMTLFLVGALVSLRVRSPLAAPLLALSALVKFFTGVLAPIFAATALRDRWGWRRAGTAAILAGVVVVATAAPWWANGAMLDGLVRGTAKSQEMDHVSPLSLALQTAGSRQPPGWSEPLLALAVPCPPAGEPVVGLSPAAAGGGCDPRFLSVRERGDAIRRAGLILFAGLALLVAVAVYRGRPPEAAAIDTLAFFTLLLTNFYPWYLIPLVALLALRHDRLGLGYLFTATALGLAYYPAYVFARFESGWPGVTVHLFLALFLTVPMLAFLAAEFGRLALRAAPRLRLTRLRHAPAATS